MESDQLWSSLDLSTPPENITKWWRLLETWRNVVTHSGSSQVGEQSPQDGAVRPTPMDSPAYYLPELVNSALGNGPRKVPNKASNFPTLHAPSSPVVSPNLAIPSVLAPVDVAPKWNISTTIPVGVTLRMPTPAPKYSYASLVRPLAVNPSPPRGIASKIPWPAVSINIPVRGAILPPAAPSAEAMPDWKRDLFRGNRHIPADRQPGSSLGASAKDTAGLAQPRGWRHRCSWSSPGRRNLSLGLPWPPNPHYIEMYRSYCCSG